MTKNNDTNKEVLGNNISSNKAFNDNNGSDLNNEYNKGKITVNKK